MMIQALVKRYEDTGGTKRGWQTRPVDFAINIDCDGSIIHIIDIRKENGKKKVRQEMLLPAEPPGRTSGIKAAFLCDNDGYLLGSDIKRGDEKFKAAAELHQNTLRGVHTNEAAALLAFFKNKPENIIVPRMNNNDKGANCVFMLNGKYVHECQEICDAWTQYCTDISEDGDLILDLVSGSKGVIESLHGAIPLSGVSMGSKPLISVNAESFTSYGRSAKDPAAQISKDAAYRYVDALTALLKSDTHHKRFAKDTLVYWAEGDGETEAETFSWFSEPRENDSEKLNALVGSIKSGVKPDYIDMNRGFHILCLSPNAGRISVRFYHADSFGSILEKINEHYENLEIYSAPRKEPEKFPYIPPWIILSETTVKKQAGDAAPLLAGQLLNSIITGANYPLTLYNAILSRIRAGEDINRTKAAIIKAVLKKNYKSEVAIMALNKESTNIPYTLGRLFSVLEAVQASAGNKGLRERYFSGACANPASIFPNLLRLSMHHSDKSEYGRGYEIQKTDLIGRLDSESPFPASLSGQEQGEFIVGYYHQQQERFTKKSNNTEEN
jgi:CRISPR-associated protein Csd1